MRRVNLANLTIVKLHCVSKKAIPFLPTGSLGGATIRAEMPEKIFKI